MALIATASGLRAQPGERLQFATHYLSPGAGLQNKITTADQFGNVFIVSTQPSPVGASKIHVTKTDAEGHVLATFIFGGSGTSVPVAAAATSSGDLLIGGSIGDNDFPLVAALKADGVGFVTKLDAGLTKIVFSTRFGAATDLGARASVNAIALNASGDIFIAGTSGLGLPVTPGAFQAQPPGASTGKTYAFVAKLSAGGDRLLFSTYFAGRLTPSYFYPCRSGLCFAGPGPVTVPNAIAIDGSGQVVIAGSTTDDIPVTPNALTQRCDCGGPLGFVAKFDSAGTHLDWSTYITPTEKFGFLGSTQQTGIGVQAIAIESTGDIVLAGYAPRAFPTSPDSMQPTLPEVAPAAPNTYTSSYGGFLARLASTGDRLLQSTYFGGNFVYYAGTASNSGWSGIRSMMTGTDGRIWITGGSAVGALPAKVTSALGQNYIAAVTPDLASVSELYTFPDGVVGGWLTLTPGGGLASTGAGGALVTAHRGSGPSIMGVAPSSAFSIADTTAPYQLVTIYGNGIGPAVGVVGNPDTEGALPRKLADIQVLFEGSPAALLYAGPNQLNAIVPTAMLDKATAHLRVVSPTATIDGPTIAVAPYQPVGMTNTGGFSVPALNQDGTINSAANPARLGSFVAVWLTGMGSPTGRDDRIDFGQSSPRAIAVFGPSASGGLRSLRVLYAGSAPQQPSGVSQVNFVLPYEKYNGDNYVRFQVEIEGVKSTPFNIFVK